MVGQQPLELLIEVRALAPELTFSVWIWWQSHQIHPTKAWPANAGDTARGAGTALR